MFDYTISTENSPKKFKNACNKIEHLFPDAKKNKILVDVDGSTIQTYTKDEKDIDVFDDYEIGAVFVKSELDLSDIFS